MPNNVSPDDLYKRSREDLLQYEDSRMNSLLQGIANFYTTRNDQSTWGNFLRALAIELAKLDYNYSYSIVNKDPSFLTPPDISRRWRDPLYVTSNWPSKTQFDTDFKLMLVELIQAYRLGSTVKSIQDVIFAYTGINIIVEELYKEIGNGVFDQSDRNSIKVSVSVGNNSLSQITTLTQLQAIVQSLYGAIDLAKPAHVGLEFTTVFGQDENIDCLITPEFLTAEQFNSLSADEQSLYTLTGYVLISPPIFWLASTPTSNPYDQGTLLRDSNGNLQLALNAGKPGLSVPLWAIGTTEITSDNQIQWENISPQPANISLTSNIVTVVVPNVFTSGTSVTLVNLAVPITATSITSNVLTVAARNDFRLATIASLDLVSNVLTVVGAHNLYVGANVGFENVGTSTYLNGQTAQVATIVPSALTVPITAVQLTSNVVTIHASNTFTAGQLVTVAATTTTAVNGTFHILSSSASQFTYALVHANIPFTADTGTATVPAQFSAAFTHSNDIFHSETGTAGELVTFHNTAESFLNNQTVAITAATPTSFSAVFIHANFSNPSDTGVASTSNFWFLDRVKLTVSTATTTSFTAAFTHVNVASQAQGHGTVTFVPAAEVNLIAYLSLSPTYQSLYQAEYTNTNCSAITAVQPWFHPGIDDTLRIFIKQVEQPPFDNMLVLAPFSWDAKATYSIDDAVTYLNQTYTSTQNNNVGNVPNASHAWVLNNAATTVAGYGERPPLTLQASSGPVGSPAVGGYNSLPTITFNIVNTVSDGVNFGYTFNTLNAPGNLPLHDGMRVTIINTTNHGGAFNITGVIRDVEMLTMTSGMFQITAPIANVIPAQVETGSGTVTPTLKSAYALVAGAYVLQQSTTDTSLNPPNKWIFLTNIDNMGNIYYTGEVSNWDIIHPIGLVAPRLDQVWEISGDQDFIFGLT